MAEIMDALEAEYCPPLDPALLSAILSDYDLSSEDGVTAARAVLDPIKEDADLEELAGFDPSGTGALEDNNVDAANQFSSEAENAQSSHETDQTSLSNEMSLLDLDTPPPEPSAADAARAEAFTAEMEKLDEDTKVQLLRDIFGETVNTYTIKHTLQKCDGKWNAAVEQLLNLVYLQEAEGAEGNAQVTKGIDAFFEENSHRRARKHKAKNQRRRNLQDSLSDSSYSPDQRPTSSTGVSNKWKSAAEDVDFIATRTGLTRAEVSSVYNAHGTSVPQTIAALLKKSSAKDIKNASADNVLIAENARELGRDFPNITQDYLTALIRLTYPSTTSAHELAKALTAKPKATNTGGIQVIPHYTRPEGLTDEAGWTTSASKRKAKTSTSTSTSPETTPTDSPYMSGSGGGDRDSYALLRARAFEQAHAAHRRAKSDRLMGGAAAYYGQVGREYAAQVSSATSAKMDQLAAKQSSSTELDLHGVDVLNAMRIACEKVDAWWAGLGESRVNGRLGALDRATGFRIVVGRGIHSAGGKGKLGPAVTKALREDGWNVEGAGAVLVVKGPAK